MDTNDLTEMTYEILSIAEEVDHIVTVHLGTICSRHSKEDEFLGEALGFVQRIIGDPEGFIEYWGIEEEVENEIFTNSLISLSKQMKRIMAIPIKDRGLTIEEIYFR